MYSHRICPAMAMRACVERAISGIAADGVIGALMAGCGPMHLVGHSHGAAVALEIAIQRPDLVRSLTLIEPAVYHLLHSGSASDLALAKTLQACPTG